MKMFDDILEINIRPITGNWTHGWALDQRTVCGTTGDSDSFIPADLDRERNGRSGALFESAYLPRSPSLTLAVHLVLFQLTYWMWLPRAFRFQSPLGALTKLLPSTFAAHFVPSHET